MYTIAFSNRIGKDEEAFYHDFFKKPRYASFYKWFTCCRAGKYTC